MWETKIAYDALKIISLLKKTGKRSNFTVIHLFQVYSIELFFGKWINPFLM